MNKAKVSESVELSETLFLLRIFSLRLIIRALSSINRQDDHQG